MSKMPVLFIAHGSPMNLLEENTYTRELRAFSKSLQSKIEKPKAVIYISAHWTTRGNILVTSSPKPPQIFDFYGFPEELYKIQYEPVGNPALADRIVSLLGSSALVDQNHGFDHAVWAAGKFLFPEAQIPSVSVSVRIDASLRDLFQIGAALLVLREEWYLIVWSGNIVHNLFESSFETNAPINPEANVFNNLIKNIIASDHPENILDIDNNPGFHFSVPTIEHFAPLIMAMGSLDKNDRPTFIHDSIQNSAVSMLCVGWGI